MIKTAANIVVRKSGERGHANHGWLDSYHTWNFANYFDPKFEGFGPLRVLNEDRVSPSEGFGTHSHREFEIWSYVISGQLRHKDSMGNLEVLKRGEIQFTSAGTGISHSEYNHSEKEPVHFLQMWAFPDQKGLKPGYQTKAFSDEQKKNNLLKVLSPAKEKGTDLDTVKINQDVTMFATLLDKDKEVVHKFQAGRSAYLHVCSTGGSIKLNNDVLLYQGDGAFITGLTELSIVGVSPTPAEFVLFDVQHDSKES